MTALYELAKEFREIAEKLEQSDLPEEVIKDTLDGCAMEFEDKVKSVASYIKNLELVANGIREAEKAQATRRKAIEARVDSLKTYLLLNMNATQIRKVDSALFTVAVRDNPVSVVIEGPVPDDYMVVPEPIAPEPYPDKAAIKKAIEDGKEVPNAKLVRGQRVEIK